jgi:replication factor A1
MNVKEVVQHILSKREDLTYQEIMNDIEKKKTASRGLLTVEAVARLVAAEHGVEITLKTPIPKIQINQLVPGLNDVTVTGRVLLINKSQTFHKPEGDGQIARLLIADKTANINIVLWNDKAALANNIQLDQIVKILHGYVRRSRSGGLELHVGHRGNIEKVQCLRDEIPCIKDTVEKISNITDKQRKTNVEGKILEIFPESTFQRKDGTQGRVLRAILEDDTGRIPLVFWNKKTEYITKAKKETIILLLNAKIKKNNRDGSLELHVDKFTNVKIRD